MSLSAPTVPAGLELIPMLHEGVAAAEALLADGQRMVASRVSADGRPIPRALDREQRAAHGLAWLATYVEALRQLAGYAERLVDAGSFGEIEDLLVRIGAGEYLAQILGGIPMSQGEIVRLADRIERLVEAAGADRRALLLAHQFGKPRPVRRRIAGSNELLDSWRNARRHRGRAQAEIGQAHDLALAHRDAAEDLRQIFAGADPDQKVLDLAKLGGFHEALGVSRQLADRFHVGREPSQPVGGALFAVERARNRAAVDADARGDSAPGVRKKRLDGRNRLAERGNKFEARGHGRGGRQHDDSADLARDRPRQARRAYSRTAAKPMRQRARSPGRGSAAAFLAKS